jgi:hypothetical protein
MVQLKYFLSNVLSILLFRPEMSLLPEVRSPSKHFRTYLVVGDFTKREVSFGFALTRGQKTDRIKLIGR